MFEYLNDMEFLTQLDKLHLHVQYAKLILLSFDEKPIREIQGDITSGTLNINSSSRVRRTINLTMLASFENAGIENIDNEISVNKKIKVLVGYRNPLKAYQKYGDIIWFPCGLFVLSTANITRSTSGWNINITGKDKMCLLDGTVGGTFPASITFHERFIEEDNGDITVEYPTFFQIIYEAVNHWGGEAIENIIITDIEDTAKMLVKYNGDKPIYFSDNYESMSFAQNDDFPHMYIYGQDAGYKETPFTYPGELVLNAGENVVTLLDKIVNTLGNYEYFYDLDGRFVFQAIKNYLNTGSPLLELGINDYVKSYNNAKFLYSLSDLDTTTSIAVNPKYENIKNDFYVWGKKTASIGGKKVDTPIRYHLAIDAKPDIDLARQYMWEVRDEESNLIVRYDFTEEDSHTADGYKVTLLAKPCDEWREELYRLALNAQVTNSVHNNYYDSELLAEWRQLYDTMNEAWDKTNHFNPDVFNEPSNLRFWLDFIDTGSALGKYSINQIGRRTKVVNEQKATSIYNSEVPDIIFIEGLDQDLIAYYQGIGQRYFQLTSEYYDLFSISSTGVSCYDIVREQMYQCLAYNTSITISCLPKYYIEPNNVINIQDRASGIDGNYMITQISLPLTYNGTMSITATEVLTRI